MWGHYMGDIADYYLDQMIDRGDWFRPTRRMPTSPVCKTCGATDLKWRLESGGWKLYENKRVQPGNYKPEHTCAKLNTPDGFDDVP